MKKKAKNLTIRYREFVGIHKLVKYETKIVVVGKTDISDSRITDEVHFISDSIPKSKASIENPDTDIGLLVWFHAASAINRKSGSKCLIYNDDIYQIATWTDVLGSNTKESDLRRVRNNRMIYYLMKENNKEFTEIILKSLTIENWKPEIVR